MNFRHHKMLNSKSLKLNVAIIRPKCSKPEKNYPEKKIKVLWGPRGNIYLSSTCRFHQTRHKIQVNCTEKWIQFFRSSENETS
jgi:hypothetical protein